MPDGVYRCFPFDSTFNWNVHDFGPLYIPRKGDRITVNQTNYKLYKQMIEWESKDSLSWKENKAYTGGFHRGYRLESVEIQRSLHGKIQERSFLEKYS